MSDTAYNNLQEYLLPEEKVEVIQFGEWGWDGYDEPEPHPVDHSLFGKLLTLEEAKPMLEKFSFYGGYGSPQCYAVRIYTNKRIIWVTQYDGSTALDSAMRNPDKSVIPDMPGS